jgi:hypothetical protein
MQDISRVIQLLHEMNAQQHRTDEAGDREIAWYWWRDEIAEALGLDSKAFEIDEEGEAL